MVVLVVIQQSKFCLMLEYYLVVFVFFLDDSDLIGSRSYKKYLGSLQVLASSLGCLLTAIC